MEPENQSSVSEFLLLGLPMRPGQQRGFFTLFLGMYLTTVLGNLLIILLIRLDSRLHTPMYFFLSHLAFSDISLSSVTVPKMLTNMQTRQQSIPYVGCIVQMYFFILFGCLDNILLAVMAYDRYVAICHPLRYTTIMREGLCVLLVTGSWIVSCAHALLHTLLLVQLSFCADNTISHFFCELTVLLKLSCSDISLNELIIFAEGVMLCFLPLGTVLGSYVYIGTVILRVPSTERLFKAFSTCGSHLIVVFLYYGTLASVYFFSSWDSKDIIASVMYVVVTPMLNPFIYSLRNRDIKQALEMCVNRVNFLKWKSLNSLIEVRNNVHEFTDELNGNRQVHRKRVTTLQHQLSPGVSHFFKAETIDTSLLGSSSISVTASWLLLDKCFHGYRLGYSKDVYIHWLLRDPNLPPPQQTGSSMGSENQSSVSVFLLLGLPMQPGQQRGFFTLFLGMYLTTVLGNLLIILLIRLDSRLHTPMYFFLSHLAFSDISLSSVTVPKMLTNMQTRKSIPYVCTAQVYFFLLFGCLDSVLLATMTYDRYMAICHPLPYTTIMREGLCVVLVAGSWIISCGSALLHTLLLVRLFLCAENIIAHLFCSLPILLMLSCLNTSVNELVIFTAGDKVVIFSFSGILVVYGNIVASILRVPSTKEIYKALSTCGSHLYSGTIILLYFSSSSRKSNDKDMIVSLMYTVDPMLNPFIYSLRNRDIKLDSF
ncbi:LOW QUALITY PROTEIN: uncharacterized protein V5649_004798 [Rhynchonycteris naso]